jgi:AbrB family looped-hinge helix DNA binding protein
MKISEHGQITIPQELRKRFGLLPFVEVEVVEENHRLVLRKKATDPCPIDQFVGILDGGGKRTDAVIEELRGP